MHVGLYGFGAGVLAGIARVIFRFCGGAVWVVVTTVVAGIGTAWVVLSPLVVLSLAAVVASASHITAGSGTAAHGPGAALVMLPVLFVSSIPTMLAVALSCLVAAGITLAGIASGLAVGLPPGIYLLVRRLRRLA